MVAFMGCKRRNRWVSGVIPFSLLFTLAACQGSGGVSGGNAGSPGENVIQPIPGPSIMRQGTIVLNPQSNQEAPIQLEARTGAVAVYASERDYTGTFSARVVEGSCISVAPVSDSRPTRVFQVQARNVPCPIASVEVTDQTGHHAIDFFAVH
jgi:hypothetical protein